VRQVGSHQLDLLDGEQFDGIYSDLGPLNCVPDLGAVARESARLLVPGGRMVLSVIGRTCPWETVYYALRGQFGRARLRGARRAVPVGLNGETVWTHYFSPREFARAFAPHFALTSYRGLLIFLPPPYLAGAYGRHPRVGATLGWLDDRLSTLPLLRDMGDHFLIVLTKRD
jgi:SAM-dependent methyltransferase